jgi:hypothetical protein
MFSPRLIAFAGAIGLGILPSAARAQPAVAEQAAAEPTETEERDGPNRVGFIIGGSLGPGMISSDHYGASNAEGYAMHLRIGWMVRPNLAIVLEPSGFGGSIDHPRGDDVRISAQQIGAMYWPIPRIWFGAGAGAGNISLTEQVPNCPPSQFLCFDHSTETVEDNRGASASVAMGIELYQRTSFVVDIRAQVTAVIADDANAHAGGAMLGLYWY